MIVDTLKNGEPFEIISASIDFERECSQNIQQGGSLAIKENDENDEARLLNMNSDDGVDNIQESNVEYLESEEQSLKIPKSAKGHFDCLVIGIGNNGCQNIDYIAQKSDSYSLVKINSEGGSGDSSSLYVPIDEGKLDLASEDSSEILDYLDSQLEEAINSSNIVIVMSSLIDEISEVTPLVAKLLKKKAKSNLVILFKPTNQIKSDVDKSQFILEKIEKEQKPDDAIKNSLVIISQEKANNCYDTMTALWDGLYSTAYDVTKCFDTFLNPQNSAKISLSKLCKMLDCGGPIFYGRITIDDIDNEGSEGASLDSLPEELSVQSFVDEADLLSARNVVAVVKSCKDFSTRANSQFREQIGKIANSNYDQSYQHQVVHLSHLLDNEIEEGKMEVTFLATGITNAEKESCKESVVQKEAEQEVPSLKPSSASSAVTKLATVPKPAKKQDTSTNKKADLSLFSRPPSHKEEEPIAFLERQHN
jgi:ferritin